MLDSTLSNALSGSLSDSLSSSLSPAGGNPVWDISSASYSQNYAVDESTAPADVYFSTDGTVMFVLSNNDDTVYQFLLSTGFDLSTAGATADASFSVTTQENNPRGLSFNPDGTKMFISGLGADAAFVYDLGTAWDLGGTVTYNSDTLSLLPDNTINIGGELNSDGTEYYVIQSGVGVMRYTLSTPYDISTGAYVSTLNVTGVDATPYGVRMHPDGNQMLLLGQGNDDIYIYTLSTAWDITTATYDSVSFDVNAQDITTTGLYINPDATKIFTVGTANDDVYEYTL